MKQNNFRCKYVFVTILTFLQQKYFVTNNHFSCSVTRDDEDGVDSMSYEVINYIHVPKKKKTVY